MDSQKPKWNYNLFVHYRNRKLAFDYKKDERVLNLKKRLEVCDIELRYPQNHLKVPCDDICLLCNSTILSDGVCLDSLLVDGKATIVMETKSDSLSMIISCDSVSSFVDGMKFDTLDSIIAKFIDVGVKG